MMQEAFYKKYLGDYTEAEAMREVLRQTERHLEEQQRLTNAADQRAVAFAAVLIVVTGILLSNSAILELTGTRFWVACLLLFAVALSVYSARPTRIYGSGGTGPSLRNHLGERREGYLLGTLIERNDRNIAHNDRVLKRSALVFRIALLFAFLAAILLLGDWAELESLFQNQTGSET